MNRPTWRYWRRQKTVAVEAVEWTGSNVAEIHAWAARERVEEVERSDKTILLCAGPGNLIFLEPVNAGCWLVGEKGDCPNTLELMTPDTFEATYETGWVRKRPDIIQAILYTGKNAPEIASWAGDAVEVVVNDHGLDDDDDGLGDYDDGFMFFAEDGQSDVGAREANETWIIKRTLLDMDRTSDYGFTRLTDMSFVNTYLPTDAKGNDIDVYKENEAWATAELAQEKNAKDQDDDQS